MCLRLQIKIRQYYYSDIDDAARTIATHRLTHLRNMHPHLLSERSIRNAFTALPQDVKLIGTHELLSGPITGTDRSPAWRQFRSLPTVRQALSCISPAPGVSPWHDCCC
jgi:hypothetical protein